MPGTDVAKQFFGGTNVAARVAKAKKLRKGVHSQAAKRGGEFPFLGTPNGVTLFTYGQDNAPVPEGTLWAVNIMTAKTGWCYWANRKKVQKMTSIWDDHPIQLEELPDPEPSHDADGDPIEWQPSYAWQLAAVNGPIVGTTVAYEGNANYMLLISEELIKISANRMEEDEACFPIIKLYNKPYPHPTKGTPTSKHQLELYGWGNLNGEVAEKIKEFPVIGNGKKAPPKRQRRRTA